MDFINKHKEAIIGVIIYVILMLVMLIFFGLYRPDPPPPEEGIVMDFGGSGGGARNPGRSTPKKNTPKPVQKKPSEPVAAKPNQSLMTQSSEESVAVPTNPHANDSEEQTQNNTPEVEEVVEQEEQVKEPVINDNVQRLQSVSFGASSNQQNLGDGAPGENDGSGGGSGGKIGSGHGNVAGNGWKLDGREYEALPKPRVANCDGEVIVDIEVDRTGRVIHAAARPGGCTACESHCIEKAVSAAKKARFNADSNAAVRQRGSITYSFNSQ